MEFSLISHSFLEVPSKPLTESSCDEGKCDASAITLNMLKFLAGKAIICLYYSTRKTEVFMYESEDCISYLHA